MSRDVSISFEGELSELKSSLDGMQGYIKSWGNSVAGLGAGAFAAWGATAAFSAIKSGLTEITAAVLDYADAAKEANQIQARLEAVVAATGNAAGFTASQLAEVAEGLRTITNVDDDVIKGAQSILLTFKEIKGDQFERATEAALDMSSVLGGELSGAAMQLGKALNDPERGMTMLTKAGVTFTEQQQEVVKSMLVVGDVAGAQNIILAEMEAQFGGAAKAAAEAAGGGFAQAAFAFDDMKEGIGQELLPLLDEMAPALSFIAEEMGALASAAITAGKEMLSAFGGEAFDSMAEQTVAAFARVRREMELMILKLKEAKAYWDFANDWDTWNPFNAKLTDAEKNLNAIQDEIAGLQSGDDAATAAVDAFRQFQSDRDAERKQIEDKIAARDKPASPASSDVKQITFDNLGSELKSMFDKAVGNKPADPLKELQSFFGSFGQGAMALGGVLGDAATTTLDMFGGGNGKKGKDAKQEQEFAAGFEDLGGLFKRIQSSAASSKTPEAKAAEESADASKETAAETRKGVDINRQLLKTMQQLREDFKTYRFPTWL